MPDLQSQSQAGAGVSDSADALSHLAKMSGTGSAFGQADYVAINPVAIAALVFAMVSLLSLLFTFFLIAAAVGVFTGLLALRQISQSNGTQSGRLFAIGGLLVSLLVGGGVGAQEAMEWQTTRAQSQQCAELLARFGAELRAEHYQGAYDTLTTDAFRQRVDLARFMGIFQQLQSIPSYGKIESIEWRGQPMSFAPVADSDAKTATTMARMKFEKFPEPMPEGMIMTNKSGSWQIDNIPRLFPEKRQKRSRQPQQQEQGNEPPQ
jgi:hypothetical protein